MSGCVYLRARARARRRRSESGAAALEFALVSPLLFALLFGIIAYGYMLSFRQGISQGAAEGARAAAVEFNSANQSTAALAALNRSLDSYGVSCVGTALIRDGSTVGSCSVSIATCSNNPAKDCASVSVNYAYRDHPLLPSFPGLGSTMPEELDYTAVAEVS
jgi:Flp pilus assembly protein TadG